MLEHEPAVYWVDDDVCECDFEHVPVSFTDFDKDSTRSEAQVMGRH